MAPFLLSKSTGNCLSKAPLRKNGSRKTFIPVIVGDCLLFGSDFRGHQDWFGLVTQPQTGPSVKLLPWVVTYWLRLPRSCCQLSFQIGSAVWDSAPDSSIACPCQH